MIIKMYFYLINENKIKKMDMNQLELIQLKILKYVKKLNLKNTEKQINKYLNLLKII